MIQPPTTAEQAEDLAAFAGLLAELAHQHLSLATDHDGKAAVVIAPQTAGHMFALAREVSRRAKALEAAL